MLVFIRLFKRVGIASSISTPVLFRWFISKLCNSKLRSSNSAIILEFDLLIVLIDQVAWVLFSGQFIYRRISLEKKKTSKIGKTRGKLKIEGNTKRMRRVSALLGKRVNLAINDYVSCWMVQRNGRRLIDGVFTDYLVTNSTSPQYRKRKRSKT